MKRAALIALSGLISVAAIGLSACAQAPERPPEEDLVVTKEHDAQYLAAKSEARKTLPIFWAKFDARPVGYSDFALKVGLKTRAGGEEHIWIDVLGRSDGKITGELLNEPYDLKGLTIGSQVVVDEAAISDWQYSTGGKLYGHFTTRALTSRANAAQRALSAELFSPQPLEAGAN